ncbi:hypothetical protein BH10CHL1_BH10CHL1_45800 [soil metagenome]
MSKKRNRSVQPRVVIITSSHLCRNPRVVKEATILHDANYEVTVISPVFSTVLEKQDALLTKQGGWRRNIAIDLRLQTVASLRLRLIRRLGSQLVGYLSWQTPYALGYGIIETLQLARKMDADIYIGHQEVGLWVVDRLAHEGFRVGVDFEDWYSEDLLPEAQAKRPIRLLRSLEQAALHRGGHITTTSHALADRFAQVYQAATPTSIYNAFSWSDREQLDNLRKDRQHSDLPSIHWVSQTIGPGRGLETLFESLYQITRPVAVHLRGSCTNSEEERLRILFPHENGHQLYIHALVPNKELLSRIAEHDIGLALEEYQPPNRNLTITNKILHYLLAGLAVIATDTLGQQEVAQLAPQAVKLCRTGDAASLASTISTFLKSPERLKATKEAALKAAQTRFCWEEQAPILLQSVERALVDN